MNNIFYIIKKMMMTILSLITELTGRDTLYVVFVPVFDGSEFDASMNITINDPRRMWNHLQGRIETYLFPANELSNAKELAFESHSVVERIRKRDLNDPSFYCKPEILADFRDPRVPLNLYVLNDRLRRELVIQQSNVVSEL